MILHPGTFWGLNQVLPGEVPRFSSSLRWVLPLIMTWPGLDPNVVLIPLPELRYVGLNCPAKASRV